MFNSDLDSRLGLFDAMLVEISDKQSVIEEKTQSGYARLNLSFTNPCITFKKLDDNRLGYFKQKNTADGLMIEMTPEKCRLHIFELKKTIDISSLEKMLKQFKGAYLNALAIGGYLGITYDQVLLYCGYRFDKLTQASDVYPLMYKRNTGESTKDNDMLIQWETERIRIETYINKEFTLVKIPLNQESGEADHCIA